MITRRRAGGYWAYCSLLDLHSFDAITPYFEGDRVECKPRDGVAETSCTTNSIQRELLQPGHIFYQSPSVPYSINYSGVAGGIEVVNAHPRLCDLIIPLVSEARESDPADLLIGLFSAAPGRELLLMGGG